MNALLIPEESAGYLQDSHSSVVRMLTAKNRGFGFDLADNPNYSYKNHHVGY